MLKEFPSDKTNGTKTPSFFFCKLHLTVVLLLILRFVSLKMHVGCFTLDLVLFLLTISGPGFFFQSQLGGMNDPPYLKFDPLELGS